MNILILYVLSPVKVQSVAGKLPVKLVTLAVVSTVTVPVAVIPAKTVFCKNWYFIQKITGVITLPGLSTIVILISFYSGIQLLGMGILGEYIGRIYEETKQRPRYILDKKINF